LFLCLFTFYLFLTRNPPTSPLFTATALLPYAESTFCECWMPFDWRFPFTRELFFLPSIYVRDPISSVGYPMICGGAQSSCYFFPPRIRTFFKEVPQVFSPLLPVSSCFCGGRSLFFLPFFSTLPESRFPVFSLPHLPALPSLR